ncbi:MAG: hypothetical protein KIT10_07375 [Flavobacteriales bacterium]|nr:hypothetical protein [Flavobacteriales bacterium]
MVDANGDLVVGGADGPLPAVLIVCQAFPPANHTGARRPYHLAKALRDAGHRTSVLTMDLKGTDPWAADLEGIEVLRLPMTRMPRGLGPLQRLLAHAFWSWEGKASHAVVRTLAFLFLPLDLASRMDLDEEVVERRLGRSPIVVATGPCWSMLEFGHRLAKRWHAVYLPDHRDPWNVWNPEVGLRTVTWYGSGLSGWLKRRHMEALERRFTANAHGFTFATHGLMENAKRVIAGRPAQVVMNGADPGPAGEVTAHGHLRVVHTGRLYHEQEWNIVIGALDRLHRASPGRPPRLLVELWGARTEDEQLLEALRACGERTGLLRIMGRAGREETLALQRSADLLLHVAFKGKRGIVPIKFLEYMRSGRPIIQAGSGQDELGAMLAETRTGRVAGDATVLADMLAQACGNKEAGEAIAHEPLEDKLTELDWENRMLAWVKFIRDIFAARTDPAWKRP